MVLDNITVDPMTHTISGETMHFTAFTVIAFTQPASFAFSDLALSPAEVNVGEVSTISVTINNNGDLSGTYDVILKIDDTVIETKQVTLGGHASQIVNFELSMDAAGIYNVGIGTLSAVLTVKEVPTQTPAPTQAPEVTPTPTPPATPAQTPAPTQGQTPPTTPYPSQPPAQTSAPTPAPVPASGTNWWLIGGIIIGVIVVGGALWFWLAHRRD